MGWLKWDDYNMAAYNGMIIIWMIIMGWLYWGDYNGMITIWMIKMGWLKCGMIIMGWL